MDKIIEKKKGLQRKHIPYIAGAIFLLIIAGWLIFGDHSSSLKVDSRTVSIETATDGLFNDYVRVNGSVLPITTVQLSPLEGGMIDQKVVEEGAAVKKGDVILKLSNPQLNIAILESEASLAEKENFLRNTRVQMEQEKLNLRKERLQLELDGEKFDLRVGKVFPEVRSGQFRTWLYITGDKPENMRAGQTYYINLELGQPTKSIIIPRGAFYQATGGAWIFVVDGDKAVRRQIKIGRQNPQFYEVLEGLSANEKVIVSSYDTYGENETLILN